MPFGTISSALSLIGASALTDRTYGFLTQMPQSYSGQPLTGFSDQNGPYNFQLSDFLALSQGEESFVRFFFNFHLEEYITLGATEALNENVSFGFLNVDLGETTPSGPLNVGSIRGFAYGSASSFGAFDIWLTPRGRVDDEYATLAHEIGHVLGLRHAQASNMPVAEQNKQFSMMAYDGHPGGPAQVRELQLYDVAALQFLYGASSAHGSSTTHSVFTTGSDNRFFALWDAGGVDEIDISDQSASGYIDLRPGFFSSLGVDTEVDHQNGQIIDAGIGNVSIAFGALIENATGSGEDDVIIGNALTNILNGGDGNDILYADGFELDGEDADYSLITLGQVIARSADPTSQLDQLFGGMGDDYLFGGRGHSLLDGGEGDDHIQGGEGDDDIVLGVGDDWFSGGAGINVFGFHAETSGTKTFANDASGTNIISALSDDARLELTFDFFAGNFDLIDGGDYDDVVLQLVDDPAASSRSFGFGDTVMTNLTLLGLDDEHEFIQIRAGDFMVDTGGAEDGWVDSLMVISSEGLTVSHSSADGFTGFGTEYVGSGHFIGGTGNDTYTLNSNLSVEGGGGSDTFIIQKNTGFYATGFSNMNSYGNQIILESMGTLSSFNVIDYFHLDDGTLIAYCLDNLGNWVDVHFDYDYFGTPMCYMHFCTLEWENDVPYRGTEHTQTYMIGGFWDQFGISVYSDYLSYIDMTVLYGPANSYPTEWSGELMDSVGNGIASPIPAFDGFSGKLDYMLTDGGDLSCRMPAMENPTRAGLLDSETGAMSTSGDHDFDAFVLPTLTDDFMPRTQARTLPYLQDDGPTPPTGAQYAMPDRAFADAFIDALDGPLQRVEHHDWI